MGGAEPSGSGNFRDTMLHAMQLARGRSAAIRHAQVHMQRWLVQGNMHAVRAIAHFGAKVPQVRRRQREFGAAEATFTTTFVTLNVLPKQR